MEGKKPRTIKCTRCGHEEKERVFGEGFTGWNILLEINQTVKVDGKDKIIHPELCPECMKKICKWLEGG